MMNLDKIHKKFIQMVEANFDTNFSADVMVESIEPNGNFSVKSGEYSLKCYTNSSTSDLIPNDLIRIKGRLVPDKSSLGKSYVMVDYCVRVTDVVRLEQPIQNYLKLKKDLKDETKPNLIKKISRIQSRKPPQIINHVGLIVLQSQKFILDTFKTQFQEKCVGKLSIYYVPDSISIIDKNGERINKVIEALNSFRTNKSIGMVCVLIDELTLDQTLLMSTGLMTKQIYKYISSSPYTTYVQQINGSSDQVIDNCLSFTFFNKQFESVYNCVEFISQIQIAYRKKINQGLTYGIDTLRRIVDMYEQRILSLEIDISELGSEYINRQKNIQIFDRVEKLLLDLLDKEKHNLIQKELKMAKSIASLICTDSVLDAMSIRNKLKSGKFVLQEKKELELEFEQSIDSDDIKAEPITIENKIENKIEIKNHELNDPNTLSTQPDGTVNRETAV